MFIYLSCYVDLNIRNSFSRHPEDGGSRFLVNIDTYLEDYRTPDSIRL